MLTSPLLGSDHLDLLVSAGFAYGVVVTDPTTAAFSRPGDLVSVRSGTDIGRRLQLQNTAGHELALRSGHIRLVDRGPTRPYDYTGVAAADLDPVEILKACQAYEHLCQASPDWSNSYARRYVTALTAAAVRRLPGYAQAPWSWTRPETRFGPAIGLSGDWQPSIEDLKWVDWATLVDEWSQARLIVVTIDVVDDFPAVPSRPSVVVLARQEIPDRLWPAVENLKPEAVVFYPAGEPWLRDQLQAGLLTAVAS